MSSTEGGGASSRRNRRWAGPEHLAEETASLAASDTGAESATSEAGGGVKDAALANKLKPDPSKDIPGLLLLLLLYTLQGVPMGLASAIPLMLQSHGFSFADKATFSMASWPYALKVLWSPVVDSVYSDRFGKRKSWVVPVQILTGAVMLAMGSHVDGELGPGMTPNVPRLTAAFFVLYFLVATQDIAVDGWALTMLRKENVGYASVCNSVGQTVGYITSYALLLALGDGEFCDKHLRQPGQRTGDPILTLGGFMSFWGAVFVLVTVAVAIFKSEKPDKASAAGGPPPDHSLAAAGAAVRDTYHAAWRVVTLPSVLSLMVVLVTCRAAFAGLEAGLDLELMQKGVPKQTILLIGLVYTPFEVLFSLFASRWTAGARPLAAFTSVYPWRIAVCFGLAVIVAAVADAQPGDAPSLSLAWYAGVTCLFVALRLCANVMFVAQMAFFNRIADPAIGGSYMTMLNTVTNMGGMWPGPAALMAIDALERKGCYPEVTDPGWLSPIVVSGRSGPDRIELPNGASCLTVTGAATCAAKGGQCSHIADGFTIVAMACVGVGLVWFAAFLPRLHALQARPRDDWLVVPEEGDEAPPASDDESS